MLKLLGSFDSCGEAKIELFDYIEVFYDQRRRHSTIGHFSPAQFGRRQAAQPNRLRNRVKPEYKIRKSDFSIVQRGLAQ